MGITAGRPVRPPPAGQQPPPAITTLPPGPMPGRHSRARLPVFSALMAVARCPHGSCPV